jgi:glycosyltransferase involved in cell wall biosynthesis
MTSSSRGGNPLGLAEAQRRAQGEKAGQLRVVAHNGAAIFGGAERALLQLLWGLQQRGHQVTLCCNHEIVADEAVKRLVPAIVLPLRGDLLINDAFAFAKFLRRERPSALLLGTFKKIWLGGIAGSRAGVQRIIARVGLASDTPRRFKYRMALRRWIDTVVLNAESMRHAFQSGEPRFENVVTIHSGIPLGRSARVGSDQGASALRSSLRIPIDAPVVGTAARLSKQKRLERLIEATALMPGVHAVIAGAGSERDKLEAAVRARGVQNRVHLIGHREDLSEVLAALDLFVITSDQEGMSNAMLEALAAGVPVLSTPVSGAHEALAPLESGMQPGIVLRSFDAGEIARAATELLAAPTTLRQMKLAARQAAQTRFDFERMLTEWEAVLRGGAPALRALRQ